MSNLFRLTMKYTVIWPFCWLTLWIYETETSFFLSNDPVFNKYTSPIFKVEYNAQSLIECGLFCQRMPKCMAFIYFPPNCQLLEEPLITISGLFAKENARYFVTGYVDEDGFRKVALSDKSHFTYKIITQPHTATTAQTECEWFNSNFVRINSRAKLDHLSHEIQANASLRSYDFYIGGYFNGKYFQFSNGEMVPAELWRTGFPDDMFGSNCLQLWKGIDWNLDDVGCEDSQPFICEK